MTLRRYIPQRGVALITAMLLMVIGVLLAARIAWDNQLHVRRATTAADIEQAKLFAMGAEAIAIAAIRIDSDDNIAATTIPTHRDSEGHLLVSQQLPVGIEDQDFGIMIGTLQDLQGRFNLNNLIDDSGATVNSLAQYQFETLLENLELDRSLSDAVIDWMDADSLPLQRGAEDSVYTSFDPPYRPPNRNFTHASELRAVAGFGELEYAAIREYVVALPAGGCVAGGARSNGVTAININFATDELLASLHPDPQLLSTVDWQAQQEAGITDLGTIFAGVDQVVQTELEGYVSTATHCFGLSVSVSIGNSVLSMYSVIERTGSAGKDVFVRQRIFGIESPD
jgi:general secretion pathway protein K